MRLYYNGEPIDPSTLPIVPITEAEYELLPDAEKQLSVLYLVNRPDADLPSSSGSSKEVYSTEETVIGTWIDGKPLYRRTYEVSGITFYSSHTNGVVIDGFDGILKACYGTLYDGEVDTTYAVPGIVNVGVPAAYGFAQTSNGNIIIVKTKDGGAITNAVAVVTIEYTKTTD